MRAKISRLGINGEGIFNIENGEDKGKVAFVDFALPEEIVDCEIVKTHSKYCNCKLNHIEKYSPNRCTPQCEYYYKCGGCDIQHMNENTQIEFKKNKILDVITKVDESKNEVDFVKKNTFNYRNKMVFPFSYKNDKLTIGMFEKNSHNVVDINGCLLASENINKAFQISKEFFSKNYSDFVDSENKCILKYLVIREIDNNYLVSIVAHKKCELNKYYELLKSKLKNVGLSIVITDNKNEILSGKYLPLYGKQTIELNEFKIDYNIDIMSFLQVNNDVKKELYQKVLDNINASDIVIDAYSGAGLMSAIIAKKCKLVIGLEINKFAHDIANKLSKKNKIENIINICGNADVLFEKYCKKYNPNTIVLDPARSGCGTKITKYLSESTDILPENIIYVSCNLATLQRDLLLIKNNYEIKYACGFDMFPMTKHIETLVVLRRKIKENKDEKN